MYKVVVSSKTGNTTNLCNSFKKYDHPNDDEESMKMRTEFAPPAYEARAV